MLFIHVTVYFSDGKEYALKLIEGTGISMSACREIAVSITATQGVQSYFAHLNLLNKE